MRAHTSGPAVPCMGYHIISHNTVCGAQATPGASCPLPLPLRVLSPFLPRRKLQQQPHNPSPCVVPTAVSVSGLQHFSRPPCAPSVYVPKEVYTPSLKWTCRYVSMQLCRTKFPLRGATVGGLSPLVLPNYKLQITNYYYRGCGRGR